jgi:hypothetical protein
MPDSVAQVYVVQRLNWVRGEEAAPDVVLFRLPGVVRLRSFDTEAEALAERDRLEEEARRRVNPFQCGGVHLRHQTSFAEPVLYDWLVDADINPPDRGEKGYDWVAWWPTVKDSLNEEQWRHVWKALDRLNFHEVIVRPRRPVVYVIGQIGWRYNDQGFDPAPEGSKPLRAYRSRERAEAECKEENLTAYCALDIGDDGVDRNDEEYEMWDRVQRASPFENAEEVAPIFYEVVEVELTDLEAAS